MRKSLIALVVIIGTSATTDMLAGLGIAGVTGDYKLLQPANADVLYGGVQYKKSVGRIGVSVNRKGLIRHVHPDSPADLAGLAPGDIVEAVNGIAKDVWHIHGTPETFVTLLVRRGEVKFQVKVKRIDYHEIRHNSAPTTFAKSETA